MKIDKSLLHYFVKNIRANEGEKEKLIEDENWITNGFWAILKVFFNTKELLRLKSKFRTIETDNELTTRVREVEGKLKDEEDSLDLEKVYLSGTRIIVKTTKERKVDGKMLSFLLGIIEKNSLSVDIFSTRFSDEAMGIYINDEPVALLATIKG